MNKTTTKPRWQMAPIDGSDPSRKPIHAYLNDEGHDEWHGFAAEQGCSVSAILQALADCGTFAVWTDAGADIDTTSVSQHMHTVIQRARAIDAARRRRIR